MSDTVAAAFARALARLRPVTDVPRSDAEELLSRLLEVGRGDLRGLATRRLTDEQLRRLEAWLARRVAGEPVQYITGRAAFRDLDLAVDARVLIPRSETELLVEAVLETLARERAAWPAPRVLDLGTGSGAIALALAHEWPAARVAASDLSAGALDVARLNASRCGLEARVRFLEGDWFGALPGDERWHVIVSNPPYVAGPEAAELPADVRDHEPPMALFSGADGLEAVRTIVEEAPRHLVAGGLLALELAESRASVVAEWLEGAHDWHGVELREDLAGRPRLVLARREHGPAIAPAQWGEDA